MTYPPTIENGLKKLVDICTEYPINVPLPVVAKYIGKDVECLRCTMATGSCPLGFGNNDSYKRSFCIPTVNFWLYVTKGVVDYSTIKESEVNK